ncbi:MAG TPA: GvpL/GvpF family gas vesicle protein [Gemmatimonadaceae bacterium]
MAIYLYCVLRATREPPATLLGIDGAPVRAVDLGGLGAWVSDVPSAPIVPSPERARSHDSVVRAALEGETPLPARFGQTLASEEELRAAVAARKEALQTALARVEGAIEMTVRMLVPRSDGERSETAGQSPRASSGREYLERVAAAQREERNVLAKTEILRDRISAAVGGLIRAESFAAAAPGSTLATLSHLVPRPDIDRYRHALRTLRRDDPALAFMVSGPWAPYSFTEGIGT